MANLANSIQLQPPTTISLNSCSTRVHHRNSDNTCSCNTYALAYFSAVQRTSMNGDRTDSSNSTSNSSSTTDSTITHYWKKCVAFYTNSNPQDLRHHTCYSHNSKYFFSKCSSATPPHLSKLNKVRKWFIWLSPKGK